MKNNVVLPELLERMLTDYEVTNYEIIDVSERKQRYCLSGVTVRGEKIFIKWNDPKNEYVYNAFQREIEIYERLNKRDIAPSIVTSSPFLATQFIDDCDTFRKYLLTVSSVDGFAEMLQNILTKYWELLVILNSNVEKSQGTLPSFVCLLKQRFYGLTLHGQRNGIDKRNLENCRNRVVSKFVWDKACKKYSDNKKTDFHWIHGDFHLNNILMDQKNNIFIIDFENVCYGDADIELAYWYVQIWILIYNKDIEFLNILDENVKSLLKLPYFNDKLFWEIVSLYKIPVMMNRRWHNGKEKINFSWFSILFYLIYK